MQFAHGEDEGELARFLTQARDSHGEEGERAARFLVEGMPQGDREALKAEFLLENLSLALKARKEFPWAAEVPEEVFLNDVLPYACLDETRESWRGEFLAKARPLVDGCKTSSEAAQALNREFFNAIDVHYDTGRKRPNQSPSESMALKMATCTGLSIILVDACRAVGVPARVVGTPLWTNKRGNHTWVEIWDDGDWHFLGADEYDAAGLNRAWFTGDAAKAQADDWKHAIWATSWKPTGFHFPMVWDLDSREVHGVNVTERYAAPTEKEGEGVTVYFRVHDRPGGQRLELPVEVLDGNGQRVGAVVTKAGTTDLNDMPSVTVARAGKYEARVRNGEWLARAAFRVEEEGGSVTIDLAWSDLVDRVPVKGGGAVEAVRMWLELLPEERHLSVPGGPLGAEEAEEVAELIWNTLRVEQEESRRGELEAKVIPAAGKEMKFLQRQFGRAPEGERSLWISMHGGGGAPASVNDQQWQNQIRIYEPKEGIVVAPRAPTNTWNLWHEAHIDALFDRLIENYVVCEGVDPNRIYLMGYSAGGDGVYQLAPRMADRFAAAAMMAGHPNDASPLGLRNLPFMIFMGGKDAAYKRNEVAADWGKKLEALRMDDPAGYEHKVTIYPDYGHWMQGDDKEALPWMAERVRNPWPRKVVWRQSGRLHRKFYWLEVEEGSAASGEVIRAEVEGARIALTVPDTRKGITLRLSDQLVPLDEAVTVVVNGEEVFSGKVERKVGAIWRSLNERMDPASVATALLELSW